ncbi:MAG: hypothetical protein ACK56I_17980, partial [bacterium]
MREAANGDGLGEQRHHGGNGEVRDERDLSLDRTQHLRLEGDARGESERHAPGRDQADPEEGHHHEAHHLVRGEARGRDADER